MVEIAKNDTVNEIFTSHLVKLMCLLKNLKKLIFYVVILPSV